MKIAIDGPAGSGKSTAGWKLAERLGFSFLDTGLMYRAAALAAARALTRQAVIQAVGRARIEALPRAGAPAAITLDGENIGAALHSADVDRRVSYVSAIAEVRASMVEAQRRFGRSGRVVMAGRDIGTVVMPNADLKIFLTASEETRAERRHRERDCIGENAGYEEVLDELRRRDNIDSSRREAPLVPARDARILSTDHMTLEQVVESMALLAEEAQR